MMWYIASRTRHKNYVRKLVEILKNGGHDVVYDWTELEDFKASGEHDLYREEAMKIANSLENSDVFVLISDEEGTDMFIELGIVIANSMKNNKPRIYVIGEHNKRSLLHFHPFIIHLDNIEQVFRREGVRF